MSLHYISYYGAFLPFILSIHSTHACIQQWFTMLFIFCWFFFLLFYYFILLTERCIDCKTRHIFYDYYINLFKMRRNWIPYHELCMVWSVVSQTTASSKYVELFLVVVFAQLIPHFYKQIQMRDGASYK